MDTKAHPNRQNRAKRVAKDAAVAEAEAAQSNIDTKSDPSLVHVHDPDRKSPNEVAHETVRDEVEAETVEDLDLDRGQDQDDNDQGHATRVTVVRAVVDVEVERVRQEEPNRRLLLPRNVISALYFACSSQLEFVRGILTSSFPLLARSVTSV